MTADFWTQTRLAAQRRIREQGAETFPDFLWLAATVGMETPVDDEAMADAFLFSGNGHIVAYHMMIRKSLGMEP